MVSSLRSNSVHIHAVQQDALSFLQISYPWLNAEDIFQNVDETTTFVQQIKDLNITHAAQADTMIEELFLEWDEFPPLSKDDYSQTNPNLEHGRMIHHHLPLKRTILHIHHQADSLPTGHHPKRKQGVKQVRHSVTVI